MADSSTRVWPLEQTELAPALRLITTLARADMGVLMLLDDAAHLLMPVLGYGLTSSQYERFEGIHPHADGAFATALAEHRLVRVRNVWKSAEAWAERARELGFKHAEILPFYRATGEALGVFAILYRTRAGSPRRAAQLATETANLFATALSHADAHLRAERARAQIAKAAASKVQFVTRMSHELRTPLQSIAGYVNLLQTSRGTTLTDDQARMLDRIAVSERILVHLIDDLISFSRLESGDIIYRSTPVSAARAIELTEGVLSPLALEQRVALRLEAPSDVVVLADAEKLQQVLVNLVANAIKYSPPGATVTLRCRDESDAVSFDVVDDGPGIPPDKLADIFEPYVRLDPASSPGTAGWGLGLAISRELAAGMRGSLTVKSEVGHGSAFTLRLPREPQSETQSATKSAMRDGAFRVTATHGAMMSPSPDGAMQRGASPLA
ncbi:MAG TPA: GAF domain-containing sensor histidine kinase [Gemmatimonadaceae bacterium]|nr:GAF domain-containing sensor histidine kinase [Gemmatimonadaceae bacterium]